MGEDVGEDMGGGEAHEASTSRLTSEAASISGADSHASLSASPTPINDAAGAAAAHANDRPGAWEEFAAGDATPAAERRGGFGGLGGFTENSPIEPLTAEVSATTMRNIRYNYRYVYRYTYRYAYRYAYRLRLPLHHPRPGSHLLAQERSTAVDPWLGHHPHALGAQLHPRQSAHGRAARRR